MQVPLELGLLSLILLLPFYLLLSIFVRALGRLATVLGQVLVKQFRD